LDQNVNNSFRKEKRIPTANDFGHAYFECGSGTLFKSGYTSEMFAEHWGRTIDYLMSVYRPQQVLDIGCAKGFLVETLRSRGISSYGVDISQYALSQAPESIRAFLHQVDVCKAVMPFVDSMFDFVICLEIVEHLPDVNHFLSEVQRVMKPGGLLFISTPSPGSEAAQADVTHINVQHAGWWIKRLSQSGIRTTQLSDWMWQGQQGRLGHVPEPVRSVLRRFIRAFQIWRGVKKHLYLVGRKI
jgi:2-polyprenyl-3-methyl-5-hydroxy-6-metoxy-1,4-benzoquinol methylase